MLPGALLARTADECPSSVSKTGKDEGDRVLSINLKSVFLVTKAVLPSMIEGVVGSVVSLASIVARQGAMNGGIHYPEKGAIPSLRPGTEAFQWAALLPILSAIPYAAAMIPTRTKCRDQHPDILAMGLNATFILVGGMGPLAGAVLLFDAAWRRTGRRWARLNGGRLRYSPR